MPALDDLGHLEVDKYAVNFFWLKGEVVGEKTWSETTIQSSGGGGAIYNGSGYIAPPKISSKSTTRTEIWIRDENGKEHPIQFSNIDISFRPGNIASVVWGISSREKSGHYAIFINHTSDRYFTPVNVADSFIGQIKGGCLFTTVALIASFLLVLNGLDIRSNLLIALGAMVFGGYIYFYLYKSLQEKLGEKRVIEDRIRAIYTMVSNSPSPTVSTIT